LSTRDSVKTPYVIGGFESQTETDSLSGLGLETTKVGEKYTDILNTVLLLSQQQ